MYCRFFIKPLTHSLLYDILVYAIIVLTAIFFFTRFPEYPPIGVSVPKNDLVSLALVYNEPLHAYAINAIIKEMGLEYWAHISSASIYSTLSRLQKVGCVAVSSEKVGNMPERKVYQITDKGKNKLLDELKSAILTPDMGDNPFYLAIVFAQGITATEAVPILKDRIKQLEIMVEHVTHEYEQLKEIKGYSGMIITKAAKKHIEIEIETAKEFIELLETNPGYYTDDLKNMINEMLTQKTDLNNGKDIV